MARITKDLIYLIHDNLTILRWYNLGPEMFTCKFNEFTITISGNYKDFTSSVVISINDDKYNNYTKIIRFQEKEHSAAFTLLLSIALK